MKLKTMIAAIGIPAFAGALVAVLVLAGECRSWRAEQKAKAAPVALPPTPQAAKTPDKTLPPMDNIKAKDPSPKERDRIGRKYNRPDLEAKEYARQLEAHITDPVNNARPAEVVNETEVPPAPAGGTALTTIEPDGGTKTTFVANKEKVFSLKGRWEFGGQLSQSLQHNAERRVQLWAASDPIRWGRLTAGASILGDFRLGSEPYTSEMPTPASDLRVAVRVIFRPKETP